MLRQFRKSTREFFHKGVIYALLFAIFVQPLNVQLLLAQHQYNKDMERVQEHYARMERTFIDPTLSIAAQQRTLCKKQLKTISKALNKIDNGEDTASLVKDIEVLQQRAKNIHFRLRSELMKIRSKLFENGLSEELIERHDKYCEKINARYKQFDQLLSIVQRNKNNDEQLKTDIQNVAEFLKPKEKNPKENSPHNKDRYLPHHDVELVSQRTGSPPYFQWPVLLAAAGDVVNQIIAMISQVNPATGLPDANDLKTDLDEINFDPNDSSDAIVVKAAELNNNPVEIYEYVRNELVYEPYFGSIKGAKRTLAEGAGNDMDLASLMMALLRASDIPCRYVFGTVEMSVDDASGWIGITDAANLIEMLENSSIPFEVDYAGGEPDTIRLGHIWVKAYVDNFPYRGAVKEDNYDGEDDGDAWIDLDPSFKQHAFTADRGIENADGIDIDPDTLLTNSLVDAAVVESGDEKYVYNIDDDLMEEQLLLLAEPVRNYLAARDLTTETVFRQRQVFDERFGMLPVTDQYKIAARGVSLNSLPDEMMHQLTVTLKDPDGQDSLTVTRNMPEIVGEKITLMYEPADSASEQLLDPNNIDDPNNFPAYLMSLKAKLIIDGENFFADTSVGMGLLQDMVITFTTPDGSTEEITHEIISGGLHSLVLDPQQIIDTDLSSHYTNMNSLYQQMDSNEVLTPDATIADVLHGIGLSYFHQMDRFNQITAGSLDVATTRQPSLVDVSWDLSVTDTWGEPNLPIFAASDRVKITLGRDVHEPVAIESPQDSKFIPEEQFFFTSALTASALEHNALMQALPGAQAASVARVIETANGKNDPNYSVYTITSLAQAENLTADGNSLENLPDFVKGDIKDAANADCEITVPKKALQISGISDCNYVGYIVRDIETSESGFVLYDADLDKITSGELIDTSIKAAQLLGEADITSDPNGYQAIKDVVESTRDWVKVAEDATTNAGLSYLPAIIDINRWFQIREELDPVTVVASVLAITGPITRLSVQSAILNVQAGSGLNGQIRSTNTEWVSADANEFIINADVTRGVTWYADIYKYGENSSYMTDTNNTPELESIFTFAAPNDGYYEYELTAGSDANEATAVSGTFRVDLTDPNAAITEVNAPDPNIHGVLVVTGTAKDNYFDFYEVYINQNDSNTLVHTSDYAVDNGTLCTIDTNDFNDGSATVILKAWDLAGNMSETSDSATISNPDRTPPDVTFTATSDGNSLSAELFVTGTIDVNVTPTDANERLQRIELWWCDQDGENCELITTEVDPNNGPIDVNNTNPWTHQINPYEFENGPGRLTVYSWDMFGNIDSNSIDFYNNSYISNFKIDPTTATSSSYNLEFTASLQESSSWTLSFSGQENIDPVETGSGTNISVTINAKTAPGDGLDDGSYLAQLTVGAQEANIPFTVALAPPVAAISNIRDDSNLDDEYREPLPIIDEGVFELEGSAYHPSFESTNVEYRVQIFKSPIGDYDLEYWNDKTYQMYWDNIVKWITPGDPNSEGWSLTNVQSGSLGELDLSGVENGAYQLLLTVRYAGSEAYANVGFILDCPLKIGNVKFSQEDMVVPVAGLPLRVIRTYDSFKKDEDGEFGHGWSYSIADMDIKLNEDRSDYPIWGGGSDSLRDSSNFDRNVTLTLPDGTRTTFVFYLDGSGYARYQSPPGVKATLEVRPAQKYPNYAGLWYAQGLDVQGWQIADYYDFPGFVLTTTEDSTKYYIERAQQYSELQLYDVCGGSPTCLMANPCGNPYLTKIIIATGEEIRLNTSLSTGKIGQLNDGIEYYDAEGNKKSAINVIYDGDHIAAIKGPDQQDTGDPNTIEYVYDSNDNLTEVWRLVDEDTNEYDVTYYYYDNPSNHFITDINDPRGLKPIRYVYDDQGRLIATIDAKGNRINISHTEINGQNAEIVYDRYGNATQYFYNDRGNVTAVVNPMGYTTSYQYGDSTNPDKATAITDPLGNTTYYEYDYYGRTTRIDDPEGNVTTNRYNSRGNLLETVQYIPNPDNPNELIEISRTTNVYSNNLLESTTDAAGNVTQYVYDPSNNNLLKTIQQVYDPNKDAVVDVTTTYTYGDPNFPSSPNSITDPAGFTRYFAYDKSGNQVKSWYDWVDANDSGTWATVYTHTEYDAMGRAIKTIREVNDVNNVTAYTKTLNETYYNSIGKVDYTINQFEAVTAYNYDELGNLVETRTYNSFADFNDFYDVNIVTIAETLYDKEGRPIVTVDVHAPDANANGTQTVYDRLGRVVETRRWADVNVPIVDINGDPNKGRTNVYDVGPNNDPNWQRGSLLTVIQTEYDIAGRVTEVNSPDEAGQWHATKYEYDAAGRQTAVIDANNNRTEYEYQGSRRILMRDARSNETRYEYDSLGRLKKTIFPDDTFTAISYDSLGRRTAQTDQAGRTRRFEYDTAGRLTAVILPAVEDPCNSDTLTYPRYEYEYDDYGNMIKSTDYIKQLKLRSASDFNPATDINDTSARETVFTYNEINKQLTRKLPLGQIEVKAYDANGLLTKITDFNDHVTTFDYDSQGRLEYKRYYVDDTNSLDPANADPNIYYQYDALGRKTNETMSDYGTITYSYDQEGRIYQIQSPESFVRYEFSDITGRRMAVRTPSDSADTRIAYSYDELGRLDGVTVDKRNDVDVTETTSYTYNAVGSLAKITYANGNYATYTYDSLNRLTNLAHKNSSNTLLASYSYTLAADGMRESVTEANSVGTTRIINWYYDALNRLETEDYNDADDSNDFEHDYIYDLVGNRLERQVIAGDGNDTLYSYNDNDQLTLEFTDANTHYTYNANGSLIEEANDVATLRTFTYNYRNRLEDVNDGTNEVSYIYNPSGIRVEADVTGGTTSNTEYLVDPYNHTGYAQVFKEIGDSNTVFVLGHDVIAQANGTSDPNYFVYDGHGSVRHLANSSGTIVESYNYDAYGVGQNLPQNPSTNLLYSGEWRDSISQQYYLRARWYSPANGRFNRMDPFSGRNQDPQSLHKYLYVHNNPVMGIDPSGKWNIACTIATVSIITLVANAFITGYTVGTMKSTGSVWPDAVALELGIAKGVSFGGVGTVFSGTVSLIYDLTLRQSFVALTAEGGVAPTAGFRSPVYRRIQPMISVGFVYNMSDISKLEGFSFVATWPWVGGFWKAMLGDAATQPLLVLAQYIRGTNIVNDRPLAVQFTKSTSGPAIASIGFMNYSYSSSFGYTRGPVELGSLGDLVPDWISEKLKRASAFLTGLNKSSSSETLGAALSSAAKAAQ